MPSLDPLRIRRILLVRLSAVGDILHALPVLRALHRWRPALEMDWLVEDRFAPLLRNLKEINNVLTVPRRTWKSQGSWSGMLRDSLGLRRSIVAGNYDVSIDLQGLIKSALWPWLAGIPWRIGFGSQDGRELSRWLANVKITPPAECRHVVDLNLSLLRALGIERPEVDLSIPVDPEAAATVEKMFEQRRWGKRPLALVQPGAGWETKRWPVPYFSALADHLVREYGFRVVVLWGPGERELAESVRSGMKEEGELAPPTDLLELIELVRRSQFFVGGDTGPMHMAAAHGIPLAAIFGASDPLRNGPYGPGHLVLTYDVDCRPSWKTTCDHLSCLRLLIPERVIPQVDAYLREKGYSAIARSSLGGPKGVAGL